LCSLPRTPTHITHTGTHRHKCRRYTLSIRWFFLIFFFPPICIFSAWFCALDFLWLFSAIYLYAHASGKKSLFVQRSAPEKLFSNGKNNTPALSPADVARRVEGRCGVGAGFARFSLLFSALSRPYCIAIYSRAHSATRFCTCNPTAGDLQRIFPAFSVYVFFSICVASPVPFRFRSPLWFRFAVVLAGSLWMVGTGSRWAMNRLCDTCSKNSKFRKITYWPLKN